MGDLAQGLHTELNALSFMTSIAAKDMKRAARIGRTPLLGNSETDAFEYLYALLGAQKRRGVMQGTAVQTNLVFYGKSDGSFYGLRWSKGLKTLEAAL